MTTRRYTKEELFRMYDAQDWATLWPIVTRMVKHAVRRCMQHGFDPSHVHNDLMQEAYLAAWEALPRWDVNQGGLQTWINEKVRSAVLNANIRETNGMVGGRDSGELVVSMHGEILEGEGDDERGLMNGHEARIYYEDPPEGYGDPAQENSEEEWLALVPEEDREMVRRLCGIGVPVETQEEYAAREGVAVITVKKWLADLRKYFYTISQKPVNHEVKAA